MTGISLRSRARCAGLASALIGTLLLTAGCTGYVAPRATEESAPTEAADLAYDQGLQAKDRGDDAAAARLFESAAMRDHPAAAFELGQAYSAGRGVAKDLKLAADWFDRSARLGDSRAQFLIGAIRYADGDYEAARPWLVAAADAGDARAQNLLGEMYMNGWGVPVDRAWAAHWYGLAANRGDTDAQFSYGAAWLGGLGLPKRPAEAYLWIALAADGGHELATKARGPLAAQLSKAVLRQAEAEARKFTPVTGNAVDARPTTRFVQFALNQLGYSAGPIDGWMGPRTAAAIGAFERDRGRKTTGQVSDTLLAELIEARS